MVLLPICRNCSMSPSYTTGFCAFAFNSLAILHSASNVDFLLTYLVSGSKNILSFSVTHSPIHFIHSGYSSLTKSTNTLALHLVEPSLSISLSKSLTALMHLDLLDNNSGCCFSNILSTDFVFLSHSLHNTPYGSSLRASRRLVGDE